MNLNLDFRELIGTEVKMFFGPIMSSTNVRGYVTHNFREGINILATSENETYNAFNFTGKIIELPSLEDSFDLKTKKVIVGLEDYVQHCMLQWRTTLSSNFLTIIGVDLYGLKDESTQESQIFALYFNCLEKEEFLIFFDFPQDGLSLSFDKDFIASFFNSDPMGKKCFKMASYSQLA